jgi:hypothetical protein
MSHEEIAKEILNTIEPYVTEWLDSNYLQMKNDLLDEIKRLNLHSLSELDIKVLSDFKNKR